MMYSTPESSEQQQAASNSNNRSSHDESTSKGKLLPLNYEPSKYSVILGRNRTSQEAEGNNHMRGIAKTALHRYSKATCKLEKSRIVTTTISMIHRKCPDGGAFVRLVDGRWNEVGEHVAREKVGYVFRELLHEKYRSSTKSKLARRRRAEQDQSTTSERKLERGQPFPDFAGARKLLDVPMKDNSILPSMLPYMDVRQTLPQSRDSSFLSSGRSIDKVLEDGFKIIAEAEKTLEGYGQEFGPKFVMDLREGGQEATKRRDFLQEARNVLLSELDIGPKDLSDLDISLVFDC